jgi:trk system potassium uptake protein TrkH
MTPAERQTRLTDFAHRNPTLLAALAYADYALLGALLLVFPLLRNPLRNDPVGFVDALFISMSAVSTTGLVTLDPGTTFNFGGQLVILILFQIGGLGYMTFMSFAYIVLRDRLGPTQTVLTRSGFGLPARFEMTGFIRRVAIAAFLTEACGAIVLAYQFHAAGTPDPVWNGVFHSVSAYCTAGFSLFPTGFEAYHGDGGILLTISLLSYLGALGFLVLVEVFEAWFVRPRKISITTKLILQVSLWLLVGGTLFLWILEPSIRALPGNEQLQNAFFQAMTASTTVGFNSVPIGALAPASILVLYLLMFIGASPAGTGGGLKTTTAATLAATALASLRGWRDASLRGYRVPPQRVQQAAGTLVMALLVTFCAVCLLDLTGTYEFDRILFEAISALSTVGLSMGATSELNSVGKLIITMVMFIGRVGILAFFVVFATGNGDQDPAFLPQRDIIL